LKAVAKKSLPIIQEHYALAQALAKRKHLSVAAQ